MTFSLHRDSYVFQLEMGCDEWRSLLPVRYLLRGVVGTGFALFGLSANVLLAVLFLTRAHYRYSLPASFPPLLSRHSPFFFLGFVAFFDILLDATYIVLLVTFPYFLQLSFSRSP